MIIKTNDYALFKVSTANFSSVSSSIKSFDSKADVKFSL